MLTVVCWRWTAPGGPRFGPEYVNRLRAGLSRHLSMPWELVCVTDQDVGIDPRIRIVPLPTTYAHTPRCRRRMQIFSRDFAEQLGKRILSIDLDVVIVGDLTPILDRSEPIVGWKVGYAGCLSGSFLLMDAGVLDGLWQRFKADPEGFPREVQRSGTPSDQAMLNAWVNRLPSRVPFWTERDGFVTYFGKGYEHREHLGVGPRQTKLPPGARIVVMGSADKAYLDAGRDPWMREHWTNLEAEVPA